MLSLYEILKASKTGIAPDMRTALAGMNWGGADSGHEVKELTGIPPLSIRSNGTMLLDYLISGNMSQTGTPTPTTPIQPQETGDLETVGAKAGQYKIPISSAGQTTPVYLGEVETTRRIKKLVLTGTNTDGTTNITTQGIIYITPLPKLKNVRNAYCSHYKYVDRSQGSSMPNNSFTTNGGAGFSLWFKTEYATVADFKTYLAAQYAAGTPVIVWYVLATPKTAVVNEPLRKIGDHADTVSYEQAGVQIPTNRGNTVIDVKTTLKPSEMYIKYQE